MAKEISIESLLREIEDLKTALESSTNILVDSQEFYPNPGYGWLARRADKQILNNRYLLGKISDQGGLHD